MDQNDDSTLQTMVRHLEDYMERNHKDIDELKSMVNNQRDVVSDKNEEIIDILHKLETRLVGQDKDIEANKSEIRRHTTYFYLMWVLYGMLFISLFGVVAKIIFTGGGA